MEQKLYICSLYNWDIILHNYIENMKKFEYKLLTIDIETLNKEDLQIKLSEKFNQWGEEGWDLVKMERIESSSIFRGAGATNGFFIIFKKEIV